MSAEIEKFPVGWTETVVMICSKCGKQFDNSESQNSPERIKSELKSVAKSELGAKIRVITTSCLNMCPVDKIAIAVASTNNDDVFKGYSVVPNSSGSEIYKKILK